MAILGSGIISLGTTAGTNRSISGEFGGGVPHSLNEYQTYLGQSSEAQISFSDFYGLSSSIHSTDFNTIWTDGDYFDTSGWDGNTSTMDTTISGTFQSSTNVIIAELTNFAGQLTFELGVSSGSKTFTNSGWTTLNLWVSNSTGSGSPTASLTRSTATFSTPSNKGQWYWYIGNQYGNTSGGSGVDGVFGTSSTTSFMELV